MSKKYSAHLVLWFLIQLLTKVECQTTLFKPIQRRGHTATLIDDKLYILGGRNKDYPEVGNEFFYTDVSVPFNTKNILWNDLTSINAVPKHNAAASVRGGANNKTLFLYGGLPYADNEVTMSLVYTFDTLSNSWSIPTINGGNTIRKDNLKAIVDDNGKMYLFGGQSNETITNDMLILDTINLKWGIGSSINAPSPRVVYGATYVSNQFLLYIGTNNLNNLKPQEALYVLNLANYEWYIPKITGIIPGSRYWHKANVIGRYMVISFGDIDFNKEASTFPIMRSVNNSRKERISAIPANNAYYYEQKPLPIPENIYGYGQQTVPIHENNNSIAISSGNNQRSSEQHIDLENLKNDIIQVV
ncbi:9996_t:CDS:2, partial [Funneliformis geosporum]